MSDTPFQETAGQSGGLDQPARDPSQWVIPDFDNPPNHNAVTLGIFIALLVLVSISVLLYAYGRIFITRYFDLKGVYLASVWTCFETYRDIGFFVHQWDVRRGTLNKFLYIAILLQWIRIFVPTGTRNTFFWISAVLIPIVGIFYFLVSLVLFVRCAPFEKHIDELNSCSGCDSSNLELADGDPSMLRWISSSSSCRNA
ncbi:hypothetical protein F5Y16DRAFT_272927 [Xylariaceae sp. FL0255]|nr:hypothetical protein F5Y16DRAFT_272927 [Xylariaceae sp. FL0255]